MCKRYNIPCKDMLRALYNLDNFSKIERKLIQTCLLLTKRQGHRKLGVESWATGRVAFSLFRWEYTANSVVPETSCSIRVCVSSFDIIERKRNIFIWNNIRSKAPSPSHFCGERSRLCCTTYYFFNMQE